MRDQRLILAAVLSVAFLGPFGGNMIMPMFRSLKSTYEVDVLLIGLGITFYMIPFSVLQLFSGAINDSLYGRRDVIISGLIIYSLGAFGVAISSNIALFLAFRALQGTGNALALPITMALVGDKFPPEMRGRVMGSFAMAVTAGAMLGPLFGGTVASVDWRMGFVGVGLLSLTFAGLMRSALSEDRVRRGGSVSKALKLIGSCLREPRILVLGFLGFTSLFVRVGVLTYLADLLTLPPHDLPDETIAILLSLPGLGGLMSGLVAGYLADRIGRIPTMVAGFIGLLAVTVAFSLPIWSRSLALLLVLQGVTAVSTSVVEVGDEVRGTATSIYGFMRFMGFAMAPAVLYPFYASYGLSGVASFCSALIAISLLLVTVVMRKEGH